MDNITKNNQTRHHVDDNSSAADSIISQLFASTLGTKALTSSWWRRWVYPVLFLITLTLSLATYLTLDSIQQAVNTYITDNQRALVGGDLVLESNQEWPAQVIEQVRSLPETQVVYDHQFSSMAVTEEQTLLVRIKGVTPAYPLYGETQTESGKPLWQQLRPDTIVIAPEVLQGLNASVGDSVTIGDGQFTISDVLTKEPDRPLSAFDFGGHVLMEEDGLAATNLLGQRSRVRYRIEMAGDEDTIAALNEQLEQTLTSYPNIRLSDIDSEDTQVSRISDNVLIFLKLLVIAVLLLSAVAMYGVITAFVTKQQANNAIRMAMGEPARQIKASYYRLLLGMSIIASIASVVLSLGLLKVGQPYLTVILPEDLGLAISPLSIIKTLIIAIILTLVITQRGLNELSTTKPATLLNQGASQQSGKLPPWYKGYQRTPLLWYGGMFIGLYLFFTYEVGSWRLSAQLLIGLIGFVAIFWALARGWLWLLSRLAKNKNISWMQRIAIHNLARKGNQSALFFVTLSLSVAVLTLITTLNHSINAQFVNAYPEDAPNIFLLDVQSEQHDEINNIIGTPVSYYPVIRARIVTAGGVAAEDIDADDDFDEPTRVFNLSYADTIMDTEYIVDAVTNDELYSPIDGQDPQKSKLQQVQPLSILDSAAEMLNVGMGDEVVFNIQGIEITGEITSIRSRFERGPSPFFYFLFEPELLAAAPQIQFATAHIPEDSIAEVQGQLIREFPAVTTVDGTAIAEQIQGLVQQMSRLVYVFTLLALLTGIMVLISSLLSTSQDRMQESASFRLLGMQKSDLYKLNILEIGVLGVSAAVFAMTIASAGSWFAITQWFNLRFSVPWVNLGIGGALLIALLFAIAIIYVRLVIGRGIMARVRAMV